MQPQARCDLSTLILVKAPPSHMVCVLGGADQASSSLSFSVSRAGFERHIILREFVMSQAQNPATLFIHSRSFSHHSLHALMTYRSLVAVMIGVFAVSLAARSSYAQPSPQQPSVAASTGYGSGTSVASTGLTATMGAAGAVSYAGAGSTSQQSTSASGGSGSSLSGAASHSNPTSVPLGQSTSQGSGFGQTHTTALNQAQVGAVAGGDATAHASTVNGTHNSGGTASAGSKTTASTPSASASGSSSGSATTAATAGH